LSFLAGFLLVSYKVKEADYEEHLTEEQIAESTMTQEPSANPPDNDAKFGSPPNTLPRIGSPPQQSSGKPLTKPVRSTNPHLEQVGFFLKRPPMHLLRRCHILCIVFAAVGFVLALVGTLCLTWHNQPLSVSVFATSCVGACLIAALASIM
jgi:hypothetical protein